jgi:hypothetical protein
MTPYDIEDTAPRAAVQEPTMTERADTYVRANPVPAIITAVAVGFALGLLARLLEGERKHEPISDCLDETTDWFGSVFRPVAKKTRRAYATSSHAVRDAVEHAGDAIRHIDTDDYVDPVVKWWKRLWS